MNRYHDVMQSLFAKIGEEPTNTSVAEEDILRAESEIGAKFPDDYREFLKDYGWSVVNHDFKLNGGGFGHVYAFFGIGKEGSKRDLIGNYKMNLDSVPRELLEIGLGDRVKVFMSLKQEDLGKIYFFDEWESKNLEIEDDLVFAVSSFDELMDAIIKCP